jgi:glucose/arabinose dehydrogenase/mono/diheme cytochrome c family protein
MGPKINKIANLMSYIKQSKSLSSMKTLQKYFTGILIWATILTLISSCTQSGNQQQLPAGDPDLGGLTLPPGFTALKVVEELGPARHLDVAANGDIYVALNNMSKGAGAVALRDTTGDGKMDLISYFGSVSGTGIKIYGEYLYFGSDTAIVRYPMSGGQLVPDENYEIVAEGFPQERQHAAKPFDFDQEGNMYVNVGAPANACMEQMRTLGSPGMDPCPILEYAGGIWRFDANRLHQDQLADGYRYATGIRNAVALRWNPTVEKLYVVQHGRDQLNQFFPELYDQQASADLPAEEFLMLEDGADFGWPYCYYDPFREAKVLAPEYGGDGEITGRCQQKTDPIMAFPAHTAPNDLLFYTGDQFPERYRNGAFVAFHGSWNRAPLEQEGYYVVFVPFRDGLPAGEWEVFADGFKGRESLYNPGDAEHRPMGLALGPDGTLYVSDSRKGTVWRIIYTGEEKARQESAVGVESGEGLLAEHPGQKVYNVSCLPCHQADGNGVPGMHPPLRDTEWVNGEKDRLIRIVVQGMRGEIEVHGETYNSIMAPLSNLDAQQVADVLTFVRKSFGNNASEVTVEEVEQVLQNL